jgi:AcrR family transcriptional regulator
VTREEVLDAAAAVFAREGYHASSLDLVAERLGVTRQAFYYHFRSKREILGALFDDVMRTLETTAVDVSVEPGSSRFLAMVRAHVDVVVGDTDVAALLVHERAEVAKIAGIDAVDRRRAYVEHFVAAYRADADAGLLEPQNAELVVDFFIGAANSVSGWYRTDPETKDAVGELVFALLRDGVVARRPEAAGAATPSRSMR